MSIPVYLSSWVNVGELGTQFKTNLLKIKKMLSIFDIQKLSHILSKELALNTYFNKQTEFAWDSQAHQNWQTTSNLKIQETRWSAQGFSFIGKHSKEYKF